MVLAFGFIAGIVFSRLLLCEFWVVLFALQVCEIVTVEVDASFAQWLYGQLKLDIRTSRISVSVNFLYECSYATIWSGNKYIFL